MQTCYRIRFRAAIPALRPVSIVLVWLLAGCAEQSSSRVEFPPAPEYGPEHRFSLDELIELSIYRNASLDVARYEVEMVAGLVDQVKALWLPKVRYNFAGAFYDNDLNYKADVYGIASLNVPLTGAYNFINSMAVAQILATGGKRTSGLKQAKLLAAIKKLDVLRQQDCVAFAVANFYHLVGLANDVDVILDDAFRRIGVLRQVSAELNQRGSLRSNSLETLEADYLLNQLEQLRITTQASRQQAYDALKQFVGLDRDEPLMLRDARLPAAVQPAQAISVYATLLKGFCNRPETRQVDLLAALGREQVTFAKTQWAPNVAFGGAYVDTQGNHHTILGAVDGLIASLLVDWPVYDPAHMGQLRTALGFEGATAALQRHVEQLIALEIEVTAVEAQRAMASLVKAARAREIASEHYALAQQAYSRELVTASTPVIAVALEAVARVQYEVALFAYHNAKAALKRVTAEREVKYGY